MQHRSSKLRWQDHREEQAGTSAFLGLGNDDFLLIILILVIQFNSINKPLIILTEILFDIIGVFIGFSHIQNGIFYRYERVGLLLSPELLCGMEYCSLDSPILLRSQGVPTFDAIVEAGRTRMTPCNSYCRCYDAWIDSTCCRIKYRFRHFIQREFNPHIYFEATILHSGTFILDNDFSVLPLQTFWHWFFVPVMYLLVKGWKIDYANSVNNRLIQVYNTSLWNSW